MPAGKYKHVIQSIEAPDPVYDDYGGRAKDGWWTLATNIRCSYEVLKGQEMLENIQTGSQIEVCFTIRHNRGILGELVAGCRIRYRDRYYEVMWLPVEVDNREILLYCKRVNYYGKG